MNSPIPVEQIPFRVLRVIQRALMEAAVSAVIPLESEHIRLAAEVYGGLEVTKQMKNPTRVSMVGNICGWYELTEIVRDKLPEGELKATVTQLLTELGWIKELIDRVREEKTQNEQGTRLG